MTTLEYTYWQDDEHWIGYLNDFPDYLTQGESFDDLKEHLADLYQEFSSGEIPHVRRRAQLELA